MKKILDIQQVWITKINTINELIYDGYEILSTSDDVSGGGEDIGTATLVNMIKYEEGDG